ncbi:BnaA09g16430D [Brassica napus]|uniref:BnaA09g16430D protein n=1 Tax=Brassica napus TaxID=3708 RepID=A0A078H2X3_BRANA|nr:BnaA09g16430D [Brassica napus]
MAKQEHSSILEALDVKKVTWYHVTTVIISGMGFFTDSYDLFVISLVTKLLGRIYYHHPGSSSPGSLPDGISAAVSGVAFAGTFIGQIFFGSLHFSSR